MVRSHLNVTMLAPKRSRLTIYGYIGPASQGYIDTKTVGQKLDAMEGANTIEVRINSHGGDAFDGLGIYQLLKSHPATIAMVIEGVAASAASLIAMAGDTIEIPANGLMMIHEPMTVAAGRMDDMNRAHEQLKQVRDAGAGIYAERSGNTLEQILTWLEEEKWFRGQQAVDAGFATSVVGSVQLPQEREASEPSMRFKHAPQDLPNFIALRSRLVSNPASTDINAIYRREYAQRKEVYQRAGVGEAEYVFSRRVDDGLETLGWHH